MQVRITAEAAEQMEKLPRIIRGRILVVIERLANWPNVSGAKPMRKELAGSFRIRTGDYRVLFTVNQQEHVVTIFRIANRRDIYE